MRISAGVELPLLDRRRIPTAPFLSHDFIESSELFIVVCVLSCVWFFATPWTVAHQASLFMEFFRWEHWSGLPFPIPGDLPDPGIENPHLLCLLHWQVDSFPLSHLESLGGCSIHCQMFNSIPGLNSLVANSNSPISNCNDPECLLILPNVSGWRGEENCPQLRTTALGWNCKICACKTWGTLCEEN